MSPRQQLQATMHASHHHYTRDMQCEEACSTAPIIIPTAVVAYCSGLSLQLCMYHAYTVHIPYVYHTYIIQVTKAALLLSKSINDRRKARGLQPRPVRAAVIGFPNVGKSALINRFLNRRVCESAPKPGVTKSLRWLRVGGDLDLLDAPGELDVIAKMWFSHTSLPTCCPAYMLLQTVDKQHCLMNQADD